MVRLAVTLGDPRGIGPEVVAKAAAAVRLESSLELVLIGPAGTQADAAPAERLTIGDWDGRSDAARAGALAAAAIERGARLALDGTVDGLVTAPIDKQALRLAGRDFPGHTEMLASLAGGVSVSMLLAAESTPLGGPLRVALATTHLRLADVAAALSTPLLVEQGELVAAGLRALWQIDNPRLALCALNPHASDGGLFGDEEERIFAPAVQALAARGVSVAGPIPADTVFSRAIRGEFDAVVAPYHDVGMAAFKTVSFGRGVNVTLGLPFVRTSPDHGTALDIAGQQVADPGSMTEAIHLGARLARAATASKAVS